MKGAFKLAKKIASFSMVATANAKRSIKMSLEVGTEQAWEFEKQL